MSTHAELWVAAQLISERSALTLVREYYELAGRFDPLPELPEQAEYVKLILLAYYGWTGGEYMNRNPSRHAFAAANEAAKRIFSAQYAGALVGERRQVALAAMPLDPMDEKRPEWLGFSLRELKAYPPVSVYGVARWYSEDFQPSEEEILLATAKHLAVQGRDK